MVAACPANIAPNTIPVDNMKTIEKTVQILVPEMALNMFVKSQWLASTTKHIENENSIFRCDNQIYKLFAPYQKANALRINKLIIRRMDATYRRTK
jgi:hypothetical protein